MTVSHTLLVVPSYQSKPCPLAVVCPRLENVAVPWDALPEMRRWGLAWPHTHQVRIEVHIDLMV